MQVAAKRLWDRFLVGGVEGNLTCRLDDARLVATPSGRIKGELTPGEMVITDMLGKALCGGIPSSEISLHARIYAERRDCQAVVHAHPPIATGFGLAGKSIPDDVLPEAGYVLGRVALVPFAIPGTESMGDAIAPYLAEHKTFLLAHHGAVTLGNSIEDAYCRMETLERVAHIVLVSQLLGNTPKLPKEGVEWLLKVGSGPNL